MTVASVVIPVFNGERFVATAVESALGQLGVDPDVIVVDDGSSDASAAILRGFGERIHLVTQENRGISAARNRGLELARGAFVAFLDCDDFWSPRFLASACAALAGAADDACAVVAGWALVDEAGAEYAGSRRHLGGRLALDDFLPESVFPPCAALYRRSAVERIGGFDADLKRFREDWHLSVRLCLAGYHFEPVDECLSFYRLHGGNTSFDLTARRAGSDLAHAKVFALADLPARVRCREDEFLAIEAMTMSALLFEAGDADRGRREFLRAVETWPGVLERDESFWAIICVEQPRGLRGTDGAPLDLARGSRRMLDLLDESFRRGFPRDVERQRAALGRAYGALAQVAYAMGDARSVVRFVRAAWRADPVGQRGLRSLAMIAKALSGVRVLRRRRVAASRALHRA